MSDCTVILCDNCESAEHVSKVCPLLSAPKPQIIVHGLACDGLMFYELPCIDSYRPKTENTRLAMASVTGGELSIPQLVRQFQLLVLVDQFRWEIVQVRQCVQGVVPFES